MSVIQMEKHFRQQGFTAMSLVCSLGHLEMFVYYLPIYK